MTRREKLLLMLVIWLVVYPGVTLVSYGFDWLRIDWPLWLRIGISTACTVPFIFVVVVPRVQKLIAAARGESQSELMMHEARNAEGPERDGRG